MPSLEEGDLLPAIIHYLRKHGVHVQPWTTSPTKELSGNFETVEQGYGSALQKESPTEAPRAGGLFGVPLHSLPISDRVPGVPEFLVDACDLLRPHLHIEGLFRKCGSLTRIKALKDVAARCAQNKMDLANLAVVFAPNLFATELCGQLSSQEDGPLQRQAAVVRLLLSRASEIGTAPQPLLEKVRVAFASQDSKDEQPPPEPEGPKERMLEGRRRRRRSMGNIVTEALSKFKAGQAFCTAPCPEISGDTLGKNTTWETPFNSKRKASDDDVAWTTELSAKKRRSILDSDDADPFDGKDREPSDQPGDLNPAQVPANSAPVFSSRDSDSSLRHESRPPESPIRENSQETKQWQETLSEKTLCPHSALLLPGLF
ncbi:hypothetical protein JRQ81_011436 [Phrynocephalus forsythii]|uniref:Rho-GAP domain-containing protein n=1 Tax=Phrynocephalus forsythii TaxID=171643 RepID=A0A9Q0X6F2_9SAUR|nr:hypothetical protein JRQ81_011436 [Phrynocephalus forsythii]